MVAMLRPVMPILDYIANYDYISQELCENKNKPYLKCNGKCYVEKIMKDADLLVKDDNSSKSTIPVKNIFFPIFIIETFEYTVSVIVRKKSNRLYYFNTLRINQLISSLFRPPQFA